MNTNRFLKGIAIYSALFVFAALCSLYQSGIQYGFGKTLNHKVTSDLQIPVSYFHDLHLYLSIKVKKVVGISLGIQTSFYKASKSNLQSAFTKMYASTGNEITYHSEGGFLEVITPYL